VAILMSAGHGCVRGILRGIRNYARTQEAWTMICGVAERADLSRLRDWAPDGLIALPPEAKRVRRVRLGGPLVVLGPVPAGVRAGCVVPDDRAIGAMAAQYLLDRGWRQFAFLGLDCWWSNPREAGFRRELEARGCVCSCLHTGPDRLERWPQWRWPGAEDMLVKWVRSLSRPVAVLAANDLLGIELAGACAHLGLRVPEDVAILGVDNDDLVCEFCRPTLSSVAVPWEKLGYEAAALLAGMMEGQAPPPEPVLIPPVDVVTRQSTDALAVADPAVLAGAKFIWTRFPEAVGVRDIAEAACVCRRTLERRFHAALGRTVHQEITRCRLARAKQLLAQGQGRIGDIGRACGFSTTARFCAVFRAKTGLRPLEYRRLIAPPH